MKVVIRSTNWIGDSVMSIPALKEIRRIFPDAKLTLCVKSWAKDVFEEVDFIDDVLIYDYRKMNFFKQVFEWRKRRFDVAILFTNSFESALLAWFAGVKQRFGYATENRGFLLTGAFSVPSWKASRHEAFYYLNLVWEVERKLFNQSNSFEDLTISIPVSEERRLKARRILQNYSVDLSRRIVALGAGSKNSLAKRWPADKYAKLNDLLQLREKTNVILLGAKDETGIAKEVLNKALLKPINLTGELSLAETIAILSEIDLLISNDMGLAHLASAVGTKTLVIFGPTNEKATKPIGSQIIRKEVACAPCMRRVCPIDHRCMNLISVEEVFEKAQSMLAS
ncbi:MAG: lipopolysaccharide heptosyltransferase II [Pyrinomonadaceae bacterium]|nr:lipopolysaccharide heptosyltransferase II [Pyrinomonadaceae bacterium]MCX7640143.1 lipopolysaccharide heptosyltransferase II [Pyrinomonadaceae bacterium]MDW8303269.1 lipopolysaccharide heptosyltransferase II [Acidobacteriota bacterium]